MEKRLDRIESKLDNVVDNIGKINTTIASQHVSIQEHIKRTNLIEEQLLPIKTQADMIKGAIKLITLAGIIVGIIEGIKAFLHP